MINLNNVANKQNEAVDIEIKALQQALEKADLQALELKSMITLAEEQLKLIRQKRAVHQEPVP